MASRFNHFRYQIKQNVLALISLVVAITALSYNTWRNELTEENRNYRAAGFEIMREAARLQLTIDTATYTDQADKKESFNDNEAIKGWVSVNLILSLSDTMTPEVQLKAEELKTVWTNNWDKLYHDKKANESVSKANSALVFQVRQQLNRLN